MQNLLISYLALRRLVGLSGLALVPLLVMQAGIQPSLSAYYFTEARDTFVCTLAVIAAFLSAYRGYDARDTWASRIAGACALAVAIFPTGDNTPISLLGHEYISVGNVHVAATVILFLCFAYISGHLFALTQHPKKRRIFRACGAVILACVVGAALGGPLFILESLAVFAFSVSWALKGLDADRVRWLD